MRYFAICALTLLLTMPVRASTPLLIMNGVEVVSPVCLVTGVPEAKRAEISASLCAQAVALIKAKGWLKVETLLLGDERLIEPNRLVVGIRANVQMMEGVGDIILLNSQLYRDGVATPSFLPMHRATVAKFDATTLAITPELTAALQIILP